MLEKRPSTRERRAQAAQAGAEGLAVAHTELTGVNAIIDVRSPSFEYGGPIPPQYTVDGPGLSPPLQWRGVPVNAEAVVLLIEDPDSHTPRPRVHAMVWDLPGRDASLPDGALSTWQEAASRTGPAPNALLSTTYLPPDPPPGEGRHRYVFQVLALDTALRFDSPPPRSALMEKIRGHVIAKGLLIGTYERV